VLALVLVAASAFTPTGIVTSDLLALDRVARSEAPAMTEEQRLRAIRSRGYPAAETKQLVDRRVWVGMSQEQALLAWGEPSRRQHRTTQTGTTEVWLYGASSLTFVKGRVATIDRGR
jgi:hypothetical protein